MLGESYYQMGEVEQALTQWEGALSISLRSPDWFTKLGPHLPTNEKNDPSFKGLVVVESPQATASSDAEAMAGDGWSQHHRDQEPWCGTDGQWTNVVIDAMEIWRCQAWALRRRHQILGEMSIDVPMTRELQQLFQSQVGQLDANLHQGLQLAKTLSSLHASSPPMQSRTFRNARCYRPVSDSYLSPLVMLCRADILTEEMELESARDAYFEALI